MKIVVFTIKVPASAYGRVCSHANNSWNHCSHDSYCNEELREVCPWYDIEKFRRFQHSWTVKAVNAYREVIDRAYQDWRRRTGVDRDRSGEERGRVVRHQGPLVEL